MRLIWNELTPKDRYLVRVTRPLSFADAGFLTQLYLPIIGVEAFALYQSLVHEVNERSGAAAEHTHRGLMLMTSLPLNRLLTARERLEAMGLLEVRRRENSHGDYFYEYLVKPPLTPAEFFQDQLFSLMLLNQIENIRYQQLRSRYADPYGAELEREFEQSENITKSFHEVFYSLKPSEFEVEQGSERELFLAEIERNYPPAKLQSQPAPAANPQLSITSLRVNLPDNANPTEVLSNDNIQIFYKLLHFYQLDSWSLGYELSDWTLYKEDGSLDLEALRKRLQQKYVEDKLNRQVAVSDDEEMTQGKLPEPNGGTYARICRQLSPLALLEIVVGGRISRPFLERAEALIFTDGMPAEVVNVLLLHTLQSKNMELPRNYIETVRDSWKAKQISTVDEAIKLIMDRAAARNQAVERTEKSKKPAEFFPRRAGKPAVMQDKLPASIQRQLEREQDKGEAPERPIDEKGKTVMDDPELKALLEQLRRRQKGV
ncbi:replication initiation and membrane attachment family protein [Brevibacillus fulvus]|uniref:Replication initiation and membrane attachment protein n=1 Tax=Brevibacillus fulvus TaxID=1125967 RepID=A0A939BVR3_9BACL|nr:DnaD domain protein [Brevibacillus fulvus]MBM7591709.1 replication initiation and membrane attachment protein [Brevibacillus fulvus]